MIQKMAILRRYDYDDLMNILEVKVFMHNSDKKPCLRILYGVDDGFFTRITNKIRIS